MRTATDERKLSLYFPFETVSEIKRVSDQLNRPKSWVVRQAWDIAKKVIATRKRSYPYKWQEDFVMAVNDISERTRGLSEREIERFAVSQARIRHRQKT